jgi:hypothetical protein
MAKRALKGNIHSLEELDEYLLETLNPSGREVANKRPQEYSTWLAEKHDETMTSLMEAYADMGVEYIQWRCLHGTGMLDERVRSSHRDQNFEVVRLATPFSNGLYHPGDFSQEDPSESMNCRCNVRPFMVPKGYVVPGLRFNPNELIRLKTQKKKARRG